MHSSLPVSAPSGRFTRALLHGGLCATGVLLGACYQHLARPSPASTSASSPQALPPTHSASAGASQSTSATRASTASSTFPSSEAGAVTSRLKELVSSSRNSLRKQTGLTTWAATASEAELRLALIVAWRSLPDREDIDLVDSIVLSRLAEIDGEMAQAVMNALQRDPDHPLSDSAKSALFAAWADSDPRGAITGALNQLQREGVDFSPTLTGVLDQVAGNFPFLAGDVASQLANFDDETVRDVGFQAHADLMLRQLDEKKDYAATMAWISATQVSPKERQFLIEALITQGIETDNLPGALSAFRQIDATANPDLTAQLIRSLAASDPETSKQMALSLPEGELRQSAAQALTHALLQRQSPSDVVAWLTSQPPSSDFDSSFEFLSRQLTATDPQTAWRCASLLSPDSDKKETLSYQAGSKWLKTDFASASQTLPSDLVQKYQLTRALLQQVADLYPGTKGELSFTPGGRRLRIDD